MRHHTVIAPCLIAALGACAAAQDESPEARPAQEPAPAEAANPMASFARLVPGEWWMTLESGHREFNTWHWGPGQHSLREEAHGADGLGNVWSEVIYWHPARKQLCLLGVSSFARGVFEGTIQFEGEIATGVFDIHQTSGLRKLVQRWAFDGPDTFRDSLLEVTGPDSLQPMVEWDRVRSPALTATRSPTSEEAPRPSERLKALQSLPDHTWEARGEWASGEAFHIQSSFEWVPGVDALYARTVALTGGAEPTHLLDAYIYHHTGTDRLRCLALSNRGGVYEGDLTVLDGGALQLDLQGYEGDLLTTCVARFDFEQDGTLRNRVWTVAGAERTLMLDVQHKQLEPKKD